MYTISLLDIMLLVRFSLYTHQPRYDRGVHVAVYSQTFAVTDIHGRDLGPWVHRPLAVTDDHGVIAAVGAQTLSRY